MAPKRTEMSNSETTKFRPLRSNRPNGRTELIWLPKAERAALTTSETMSKKPSAATNPRLAARARTSRDRVVPVGRTFHMAFNADCISPNTPEAVANRRRVLPSATVP
jgi:hypothetical protein